jgi:ribonuclease P protein component
MLAREFILKDKEDFEKVEKEGRLFQSDSFGVAVLERRDTGSPRFGFIVSGKISKEAVQRNRIKRALSEAMRYELATIKKGVDVVFLAKQICTKKSTDVLMREVKEVLPKVGILK